MSERPRFREPVALRVFRIGIGLAVVALMGLLYWSSSLIEQEVKGLRLEMRQLQGELGSLQVHAPAIAGLSTRPHLDPSLPNLLQEDPFYRTTLPQLLGSNFRPQGTLRTAVMGRPQDFHPFSQWLDAVRMYSACLGGLASRVTGTYEQFSPDLAIKIEERSSPEGPEYWVHLREGVFWAPLDPKNLPNDLKLAAWFTQSHPVTARDFEFYFNAFMNPHVQEPLAASLRPEYADVAEFRVIDDLTFAVRWKSREVTLPDGTVTRRPKYLAWRLTAGLLPLPGWVYQYFSDGSTILDDPHPDDYRVNSVWAQNFSQHWAKNIVVSCGPWIFDGLTDREIRLKRNPRYHNPLAALTERQVIYFKTSPDAMWQDFKAGKIDLFDSTYAPQKLLELDEFRKSSVYSAQVSPISRVDYLNRSFRYVGWNQKRPFFSSANVRRALTMAIDRQRIIEQCLGRMGIETTGPLIPGDWSYSSELTAWPYDPAEAVALLRAEGWEDTDGDGILDREIDGKRQKFSFKLIYYAHSQNGRLIVDSITTSLREIGIECQGAGIDVADLAAAFEGKDFDAVCMAWVSPVPESEPGQIWHSSGAVAKGSSNAVGFANTEVDSIIDQLHYAYDSGEREALYHRFHNIIHQEEPYTFLYVPRTALLYRDYVQNVFVPAERPDLIPGAEVTEPVQALFWLREAS